MLSTSEASISEKIKMTENKNPEQNQKRNFIITKKVAKHGTQSIIVIPRILESHLKPGTIVQLNIDILGEK